MLVIPAIDIIGGNVVRLSLGDYDRKSLYSTSAVEKAKEFENAGLKRLHLVDLDGAASNGIKNLKTLEEIKSRTSLIVDFGGGIKKEDDLKDAFDAGADYVTLGSIAVKNRDLTVDLLKKYEGRLILGADSKDGIIKSSGWLEDENVEVISFIKSYSGLGFSSVIATDISKDGMLSGPSFSLYEQIMKSADIPLIASGGVKDKEDLIKLKEMGLSAAIVGKAYYEGFITLKEMQEVSVAC